MLQLLAFLQSLLNLLVVRVAGALWLSGRVKGLEHDCKPLKQEHSMPVSALHKCSPITPFPTRGAQTSGHGTEGLRNTATSEVIALADRVPPLCRARFAH